MKKNVAFIILMMILFILPVHAGDSSCLVQAISPLSVTRSYKDISKKFWVVSKLKNQYEIQSQDNKNILIKYIFGAVCGEDTFSLMNAYLRGNLNDYIKSKDITNPLKHRLDFYAKSLSSVLTKVRLPQNVILYSSYNEKDINVLFPGLKEEFKMPACNENCDKIRKTLKGKTFKEKGFLLTSYDENFVTKTKFRLEIKAPKNLQAIYVDKEFAKIVIINKGYRWKVVDVNKCYDKNTKSDFYKIIVKIVL